MIVSSSIMIASTTPTNTTADSAKADMNYDSFLKLLVASMKDQDPTQPNDPSETLSQLASFANVEQSIKINSRLDQLLSTMTSGQAASLIGREVASLDGTRSGQVRSVEISEGSLVAILQDGGRIDLNEPVRIS